jgi:hypothetical protein
MDSSFPMESLTPTVPKSNQNTQIKKMGPKVIVVLMSSTSVPKQAETVTVVVPPQFFP